MTISPDTLSAVTAALIAVIVSTLQWVVTSRFLPRVIEKQVSLAQAERQLELDAQRQEREQHNVLIQATIESVKKQQSQNDAIVEQSQTLVEQNGALVKSVVSLVEVHAQTSAKVEGLGMALTANTRITTEGVEAIGELSDNLAILLNKGSKPLQAVQVDVQTGIDSILKAVAASKDQTVEKLEELRKLIVEWKLELTVAEKVIEDKTKIATGEISILPLPPNTPSIAPSAGGFMPL